MNEILVGRMQAGQIVQENVTYRKVHEYIKQMLYYSLQTFNRRNKVMVLAESDC